MKEQNPFPVSTDERDSLNDTVEDLKTKFKPHEVILTFSCAGNRRSEL